MPPREPHFERVRPFRGSLAGAFFGLLAAVVALGTALAVLRLPTGGNIAVSILGAVLALVTLVDVGALVALAVAMLRRVRSKASPSTPSVSVLVAAWNEREVIERTVRGLLAQGEVELEVIVADDGSTDGTGTVVERAFRDDPRVRLVRIEHAGKGAALEAARRLARHPFIATVDADTDLEPLALARLARALGGDVVAAGGAVLVKDAESTLGRFQFLEYVKTTWIRAAWAELSMLEQLPGAFSIFDAMALERAGGFPLDSLTEDYEISYRLYDEAARTGRTIHIAFVPEARAWTAPPDSLSGFVGQRTRWFAGFLSTLVRFSRLIGRPSAGRFGLIRLPLKCVDAVTPIVGIVGLVSLAATLVLSVMEGHLSSLAPVLALPLLARALSDVALYLAARSLVGTLDRAPRFSLGRLVSGRFVSGLWGELLFVAIDALSYGILRQLVVLRAYPFAAARVRTWERSRALPVDVAPDEDAYAPAE